MNTQKIRLSIEGMTCQVCAARIEKVLNRQTAVSEANVNFAAEEATVVWDSTILDEAQLIHIIEKSGFHAHKAEEHEVQTAHLPWRLMAIWLLALPFLWGMFAMLAGQTQWIVPAPWQALLASVVQLGLALPFYRGAYAALRSGSANMDVLVVLGTTAIWLYSLFALFSGSHVYFESSVMVIAFVSLGKYGEMRAKKGSLNSIGSLIQLTPPQAQVWINEQWQMCDYADIQIDMRVRVRQGERVCADGVVEEGEAWAEESHLTGEAKPIFKQNGSFILAGSILNEGSVVFRTQALGKHTLLGDMIQALNEAQGSKAPIARLADRVAAVFVPVVMGIAFITFLLTYGFSGSLNNALMHAVSVLVIACPCALGLATPAAIMTGMGLAARKGVWFKDAAIMEETARINTVVLDKTGTLTEGKPQIVDMWLAEAKDEAQIWQALLSVESHSTHPLAKTLVQAAIEQQAQVQEATQIDNQIGQGISAQVHDIGMVRVGSADFCDFRLPENTLWQTSSVVAVNINQQPVAAFALRDILRADSIQTIRQLQQMGIAVYMMSGDNNSVVADIAQQLGLPESQAQGQMTPRKKAQAIQQLRERGWVVAMVGDGVNDAPALASAHVGMALRSGSDMATQTADVTLMRHSAAQVYDALWTARATVHNIRQNLFFAFIYNILCIPLAALGYLNPMIAGAAMALSSVSVLTNALRLKRAQAPNQSS